MTVAPPPPALEDLPAGTVLVAGLGFSTILPDLDVETYSEAGWVFNPALGQFERPPGSPPSKSGGLTICGAAVYAEHPTTELLSLAYDLKDGRGRRHWKPGDAPPQDLFAHIAAGGLIEAWNSAFEQWIWNKVCRDRMGWPHLPPAQLRCAMGKSRAHALPGALAEAARVAGAKALKDPEGDRLLKKFSIPKKPSKKDGRLRIRPEDEPDDARKLYSYNISDIAAEADTSSRVPDLAPDELNFWLCDQEINRRGVAMDVAGIHNCIAIVEQAFAKYNAELSQLTGGAVQTASQLPALKIWLASRGLVIYTLREEDLDELLAVKELDPLARRALEIRSLIGSASIKKLYAMRNMLTRAGRLHDLFNYHAARTGRAGGADTQPHNLPRNGLSLFQCTSQICARHFGTHTFVCPWCGAVQPPTIKKLEWAPKAFEDAFSVLATRSLECVEMFFGNAMDLIIGCLRPLFIAADGHDLIASDYSAIEGVVTAALAGEDWRLKVFAAGEDIYLHSASQTTGIPVAEYIRYKKETGHHHPHRQPFGKIQELSLGYGGWIGAVVQFGGDEFFTEDEIKRNILKWRAASPGIVELWGGQFRGLPWNPDYHREYFGLEGMAILAVLNPGRPFTYCAPHPLARPITYLVRGDVLYCVLPSGRPLAYHRPRLEAGSAGLHSDGLTLTYEGWNTNPKNGPYGWIRMNTYGGKLTENVVQAVARDVLAHAIVKLERAAYPVVLHVHDEIVAEVAKSFGTVEELERIMGDLPEWAKGWPLRAAGGWRGRRYRKD